MKNLVNKTLVLASVLSVVGMSAAQARFGRHDRHDRSECWDAQRELQWAQTAANGAASAVTNAQRICGGNIVCMQGIYNASRDAYENLQSAAARVREACR